MIEKSAAKEHYDIVIVGQGLAGSLLAWSLVQGGKTVCIISDEQACASRVAAGLINPVTGQRFVLADLTPKMLAFAHTFYRHLEKELGIHFFHLQSMLRLFNSEKEHQNCSRRFTQEAYKPFLSSEKPPEHLSAEYSGIRQNHTAWLDTNLLLDHIASHFSKHGCFKKGSVTPRNLTLGHNHIEWENLTTNKIIFCQGYKSMDNPLFSWLPMQPAHGEIITCTSSEELAPDIINKSKWLLPISSSKCRIGATYETTQKKPATQQKSKQDLLNFGHDLFKQQVAFECVEHQAGIRPATKDKQPFIGFHPQHPNIGIFNGFGSRGSLMIPWYSKAFTHSLNHHATIPEEASILRYQSLCV